MGPEVPALLPPAGTVYGSASRSQTSRVPERWFPPTALGYVETMAQAENPAEVGGVVGEPSRFRSVARESIALLREIRGQEQVTFDDICDHLEEFVSLRPAYETAVAAVASYLRHVEFEPHRHPEREDDD